MFVCPCQQKILYSERLDYLRIILTDPNGMEKILELNGTEPSCSFSIIKVLFVFLNAYFHGSLSFQDDTEWNYSFKC